MGPIHKVWQRRDTLQALFTKQGFIAQFENPLSHALLQDFKLLCPKFNMKLSHSYDFVGGEAACEPMCLILSKNESKISLLSLGIY